jgi:hypothetical protein
LLTARQIGDVPTTIFKVFHPVSHTADSHAGISIGVIKLIQNVCSRIVLLEKKFSHSTPAKWYIICSHFVTLDHW